MKTKLLGNSINYFDLKNGQMLPKEELYTPPINIKVRDSRPFGRKPTVGVCSVKSLEAYRRRPISYDDEDDLDGVPRGGMVWHKFSIATVFWWSKMYSFLLALQSKYQISRISLKFVFNSGNIFDGENVIAQDHVIDMKTDVALVSIFCLISLCINQQSFDHVTDWWYVTVVNLNIKIL